MIRARRLALAVLGLAALAASLAPTQADEAVCRGYFDAGNAALDDGNPVGAEGFFRLGIEAGEPADPAGLAADCLIDTYGRIMAVYQFDGRLADEAAALERRLALRTARLGRGHDDLMFEVHDLAGLYLELEQAGAAARYMERVLVFDIRTFGPDSQAVGDGHYFIASLYEEAGEGKAAVPFYDRALTILAGALPPGHPDIIRIATDYAGLLAELGRDVPAASLRARFGLAGR